MVRIYKNGIAYIVCEVQFSFTIILKLPSNDIIVLLSLGSLIICFMQDSLIILFVVPIDISFLNIFDDFIIEFFRPDPIAINKQLAEGKQNKIGFQHINQ